MSRFSWLLPRHVGAICGCPHWAATAIVKQFDPKCPKLKQPQMTAGQLMEWWEAERGSQPPPLLIALIADEREYPPWLKALVFEWKVYESMKFAEYSPRVARAKTEEQARAVLDVLPEIEARGYLDDEGLPPEMKMDDRFVWFDDGGEADG